MKQREFRVINKGIYRAIQRCCFDNIEKAGYGYEMGCLISAEFTPRVNETDVVMHTIFTIAEQEILDIEEVIRFIITMAVRHPDDNPKVKDDESIHVYLYHMILEWHYTNDMNKYNEYRDIEYSLEQQIEQWNTVKKVQH